MPAPNGQFLKGEHWRPERAHWSADWLRHEYVVRQRSSGEIAGDLQITNAAVIYWFRKHGIPRRTISQARGIKHWGQFGEDNPMHGKTGEANPRYVDGSSLERQRLYVQGEGRKFLREILDRDNYQCFRCAAPKTGDKSLHVHHITPWTGNPSLRFSPSNVVTLCRTCHHWVHSKKNEKREYLA